MGGTQGARLGRESGAGTPSKDGHRTLSPWPGPQSHGWYPKPTAGIQSPWPGVPAEDKHRTPCPKPGPQAHGWYPKPTARTPNPQPGLQTPNKLESRAHGQDPLLRTSTGPPPCWHHHHSQPGTGPSGTPEAVGWEAEGVPGGVGAPLDPAPFSTPKAVGWRLRGSQKVLRSPRGPAPPAAPSPRSPCPTWSLTSPR